jgi:acetoin:2,6-dichlorophenolindophenol oxidoreductase subunit beta
MARTVADTIKEITRYHLEENNGLLFGQAISAVGWVNHTVPDCQGIVEFPMADVSNMGIACGAAISGIRPIIVIRFQDFMWLNGSTLVNYAAKTKEIFGTTTPIFVRALAMENAGCTHSGVLHSLFMHMPGFRICSPMTPREYEEIWDDFLAHDDPMYVSEHRRSFQNTEEMPNSCHKADVTLIGISAARFNIAAAVALLADEGITCNVAHCYWLKPFKKEAMLQALDQSRMGLVVDAGFETCGAAQSLAYELMWETGKPVKALGLFDRSVGVNAASQNQTPSAERIAETVFQTYHNQAREPLMRERSDGSLCGVGLPAFDAQQ